jgi:hypothetical protein
MNRICAALEEFADDVPQRADAAQHRRGEHAHQPAVAVGERRQAGMRLELEVERALAPQHIVEDVGGDAAGGETGHFRRRCTSCCRCHEAPFCPVSGGKLFTAAESLPAF